MSVCVRCGHAESSHETVEYRGDKGRRCLSVEGGDKCRCCGYSERYGFDDRTHDLVVAANQIVTNAPGRYPYLEAAVRVFTRHKYEP